MDKVESFDESAFTTRGGGISYANEAPFDTSLTWEMISGSENHSLGAAALLLKETDKAETTSEDRASDDEMLQSSTTQVISLARHALIKKAWRVRGKREMARRREPNEAEDRTRTRNRYPCDNRGTARLLDIAKTSRFMVSVRGGLFLTLKLRLVKSIHWSQVVDLGMPFPDSQ